MLFCGICLKGVDATTGWIIRVPVCNEDHALHVCANYVTQTAWYCNFAYSVRHIPSVSIFQGPYASIFGQLHVVRIFS